MGQGRFHESQHCELAWNWELDVVVESEGFSRQMEQNVSQRPETLHRNRAHGKTKYIAPFNLHRGHIIQKVPREVQDTL